MKTGKNLEAMKWNGSGEPGARCSFKLIKARVQGAEESADQRPDT